MKKSIIVLLLLSILFSCAQVAPDGGINHYIYPYLRFTQTENGYSVSVIKGAKVDSLHIPSYIDGDVGKIKVVKFLGFDDRNDAKELKQLTLSADIVIEESFYTYATNIESIERTEVTKETRWVLPDPAPRKEGYHFLGWFVDGKEVHNGDLIEEGKTVVTPLYEKHNVVYNFNDEDHWEICSICGQAISGRARHHFVGAEGSQYCDVCEYGKNPDDLICEALNATTGVFYETISEAITNVKDGETIKLIKKASSVEQLQINNTMTLDLNYCELDALLDLVSGELTITGKGTINPVSNKDESIPVIKVGKDASLIFENGKVICKRVPDGSTSSKEFGRFCIVNGGNTIINGGSFEVTSNNPVFQMNETNKGTLTINGGTFESDWGIINVNGKVDDTIPQVKIEINGGEFNACSYLAGYADTKITDGRFHGKSYTFEIRAGKLDISGGTFDCEATETVVTPNGNGSTIKGVAIGISQHNTKQAIDVKISGGTFEAPTPVYETNTQTTPAIVSLAIKGGRFNSTNDSAEVIHSDSCTSFISGGTFNKKPNDSYLEYGLAAEEDASGDYTVVESKHWIHYADTSWYSEDQSTFDIDSAEKLAGFAKLVNNGNSFQGKTINLTKEVNLATYEWTPIGKKGSPFKGTFNGNSNVISNLHIEDETAEYVGLFGILNSPGKIENVNIQNANVKGLRHVGTLIGSSFTGSISGCKVTGDIKVEGNYKVGGLSGEGYAAITNCSVIGSNGSYVKGIYKESDYEGDNVGGIIGYSGEGNITFNTCTVKNIDVEGTRKVGGLIGSIAPSKNNRLISDCSFSGTVSSNASDDYMQGIKPIMYVGGLVGEFVGNKGYTLTFTNCVVEPGTTITGVYANATKELCGGSRYGATAVNDGSTFDGVTITIK